MFNYEYILPPGTYLIITSAILYWCCTTKWCRVNVAIMVLMHWCLHHLFTVTWRQLARHSIISVHDHYTLIIKAIAFATHTDICRAVSSCISHEIGGHIEYGLQGRSHMARCMYWHYHIYGPTYTCEWYFRCLPSCADCFDTILGLKYWFVCYLLPDCKLTSGLLCHMQHQGKWAVYTQCWQVTRLRPVWQQRVGV